MMKGTDYIHVDVNQTMMAKLQIPLLGEWIT
jgi:hypothetical protein